MYVVKKKTIKLKFNLLFFNFVKLKKFNNFKIIYKNFSSKEKYIQIQNENIVAFDYKYETKEKFGKPKAIVLDIISIMDIDNFEPITTELLKYGLRVNVLILPAHDMLKEK